MTLDIPRSPAGSCHGQVRAVDEGRRHVKLLLTREEEFETWLTGAPDETLSLAQEYPPDRMRIVQE